jgi:Tfp pilus assembly protein PilV
MTQRLVEDKRKINSGAALTEGIVAITIISVAIVSILALLVMNLRQIQISRSQFIASQLAMEGVEVVRLIRDENWINRRSWNTGLGPGNYQVQYNSRALETFTGNPLRLDPNSKRYQYATGPNTEFTRRIIIQHVSPDQIRVISNVSWTVRNIAEPFEINTEKHLFNWMPPPP